MEWIDKQHLQIGDTSFFLASKQDEWEGLESQPDQFVLAKTKNMVERHLSHAPTPISNIVDLGIFKGGSIALFQQLFSPSCMVGVDLEANRVAALDHFIDRHSLGDVIHLYYGTSQEDRERLTNIVQENFGAEPLDFVVDDCSHLYEPTKSSFNVLFPRLRPGGLFLIEDWRHAPSDQTPLSNLILELVMVASGGRGLIRELHIQGATVYVTRGDDVVPGEGFDISRAYPTDRSFQKA